MGPREISNQLAVLAERFVGRGSAPTGTVKDLWLADQIREVLVPVQASANYRRRLRGELLLAAQGRPVKSRLSLFRQHRKGILIGAAAVGSVASAVGVIVAFIVRYRHGAKSHTATG